MGEPVRAFSFVCIIAVALVACGCAREDEQLRQHRQKFQSFAATMAAIDEAWLSGDLSGTSTINALDETMRLVEQQRAALAASPEMIADPRGAQLSQAAERLSRLLAATIRDVRAADADAVRRNLAASPVAPGQP